MHMHDLEKETAHKFREKHLNNWHETWAAFNYALRSTNDFSAFQWTLRLLKSGIVFGYIKLGLYKLKIHIYWRSWVPAFAIALISLVVLSYFGSLREIVEERWCCRHEDTEMKNSCSNSETTSSCRWIFFHDTAVLYFGLMIVFNFLSASFRSPGIVVAKQQQVQSLVEKISMTNSKRKSRFLKYFSVGTKSGFYSINPMLNSINENNRNIIEHNSKQDQFFPSIQHTFCDKCAIKRPPRSHHCSVCDCCVLQFDHHCVWLNNCVGYNNHRAFLLTLLYLNFGCWYGIFMLCRPFLETMTKSSGKNGGSSFLEFPSLFYVLSSISGGSVEKEAIIKLVFPLLFVVGLLQAVFFGHHLFYVASALTTLEYKILLEKELKELGENSSTSCITLRNPFNRGWLQNLKCVLGPLFLIFLPIQVNPKETNLIL